MSPLKSKVWQSAHISINTAHRHGLVPIGSHGPTVRTHCQPAFTQGQDWAVCAEIPMDIPTSALHVSCVCLQTPLHAQTACPLCVCPQTPLHAPCASHVSTSRPRCMQELHNLFYHNHQLPPDPPAAAAAWPVCAVVTVCLQQELGPDSISCQQLHKPTSTCCLDVQRPVIASFKWRMQLYVGRTASLPALHTASLCWPVILTTPSPDILLRQDAASSQKHNQNSCICL